MDSSKDARIERAIAHLNAQERPNYSEASELFDIDRTTLWRRHNGLTVSRAEANSTYRQRLNNTQEKELLRYIAALTDRHIPPTTQIIKNLAEEILKGPVGKNWTAGFVKRHSKHICSLYLRPLDRARASAESVSIFERFYVLV